MVEFRRALGDALRRARLSRGLTLSDLAERCGGVARPTSIGGYERGERAISVERLAALARGLAVPAEQILSDALAAVDPEGYGEVSLDTTHLPTSPVGRAAGEMIRHVRDVRGDVASPVLTLRRGDLLRMASDAGMNAVQAITELGDAVLRWGSPVSARPPT